MTLPRLFLSGKFSPGIDRWQKPPSRLLTGERPYCFSFLSPGLLRQGSHSSGCSLSTFRLALQVRVFEHLIISLWRWFGSAEEHTEGPPWMRRKREVSGGWGRAMRSCSPALLPVGARQFQEQLTPALAPKISYHDKPKWNLPPCQHFWSGF